MRIGRKKASASLRGAMIADDFARLIVMFMLSHYPISSS
jgi:hypothetical protein